MIRLSILISFFNFFFIFNSVAQNVSNIVILGNERLSTESIKVIGNINLDDNYDNDRLNKLSKELYKSNFFKNLSIKIENNSLIIDIVENPIIESIEIQGIKNKSLNNFLIENISLKNRQPYTENLLKTDLNLIKNILKSNGYYFVKITPSITENSKLNSLSINFNIDQGSKAKIKNIKFIGEKKIKDKKILDVIASEEHKFWKIISKNVYLDQNRIDLDRKLIENYYKNLGYYDVKVLNSFSEFNKLGYFDLIFNISAGDYYYFNELTLNLPNDYSRKDFEKIENFFDKIKGKRYSLDDFNLILSDIENIASTKMYDFIDATVDEEIVENDKINFTFNISDSTKFYIEEINILGNYYTLEEVIRNNLIVDEGDPLNRILFNKSLDNLSSLGIFKNVKSNIIDGSNQNFKKIDITVEEQPTGEISLAAGAGTNGTVIGGGVSEKNFLGKGINLNTNLEISDSTIKGQFIYSKPNFAYTDNTLSTSLISTTTDNLDDYGYKVTSNGFTIGTGFEQYENFFFNPEISVSHENLDTNSTATQNLKKQEGSYSDLYFNYGTSYDLRNSKFRPSSGNRINFYQELPLISDGNEIINSLTFDQYKKLSKNSDMIGKASFYFKSVNSIDTKNDVRISKRASIPYSRLRGFEKGKIGPIDNNDFIGGNYASVINLSTNLPFILSSLETVEFKYFIDAANVWGVDYDKTIDDSNIIRSSTGIGMDFISPIGPISFSLAQPITKKSSDKTEVFRFNIGTTF